MTPRRGALVLIIIALVLAAIPAAWLSLRARGPSAETTYASLLSTSFTPEELPRKSEALRITPLREDVARDGRLSVVGVVSIDVGTTDGLYAIEYTVFEDRRGAQREYRTIAGGGESVISRIKPEGVGEHAECVLIEYRSDFPHGVSCISQWRNVFVHVAADPYTDAQLLWAVQLARGAVAHLQNL